MHHTTRNSIACAVFLAVIHAEPVAHAGPAPSFTYGHAYTPIDGGWVIELDEQLREVRRFQVEGVETATGATFGPNGNLVFIGRRFGSVRVMEVDAGGTIVNEYDTGSGSLLRGSYIDYDPVTKVFAFADDDHITLLNPDMSFHATTSSFDFNRASGVAFDPNGSIFATDQLDSLLVQFDSELAFVGSQGAGSVPTGIDITAERQLYLTNFGNGSLRHIDLVTGASSVLVSGLGYGELSDVEVLPDGNLLTVSAVGLPRLFAPDGSLLLSGFAAPDFGDSIAYFIPAPPGICMFLVLAPSRRRR